MSQRVHFVGIGGAGMSGLAKVLYSQGHQVSGSDLFASNTTRALAEQGIAVYHGHAGLQVAGAERVVRSTAIPEDNLELAYARTQNIPILSRGQLLAELMQGRYGVAVAGSHGKTTTTGLIASICLAAACDPSVVMGGYLNEIQSHACLGKGPLFIAEADESDASFLYLRPRIAVTLNLDADHLTTYEGDFNRLIESFERFLHRLPPEGQAILCIDDPLLAQLSRRLSCPVICYGFSNAANVRAVAVCPAGFRIHFTVLRAARPPLPIQLNLPGRHNVLNALAAISVATALNLPDQAIQKALERFSGIGRRFHCLGEVAVGDGTALVLDDYGHHPQEIAATLSAICEGWPDRRLLTVFQPHRYTRTRDLLDDFAKVLSTVDPLLLLEVYSAGESPLPGVGSQLLAAAIGKHGGAFSLIEDEAQLFRQLKRLLRSEDILLFQGAGDITHMAHRFIQEGV